MSCRLIVRHEGGEHTVDLGDKPVIIGRGEECEIPIFDTKCSRRHCEVRKTDQGYKVVDLESRNGTRVNDSQVNQQLLAHGDVIRIGQAAITFEDTLRDPDRKIPGRVGDYRPEGAAPIAVQPGAIDLKPPPFQPKPSLRKTTERFRAFEVLGRGTEGVPMAKLSRREEIRREAEERSMIKTIGVIVGVFFGLIILFVGFSFLGRRSPERRGYERAYAEASEILAEANNSGASNPRAAAERCREALRITRRIPQDGGDMYVKGQALAADIEDCIQRMEALTHREEAETLEMIWTKATKARSSREVEGLLEEITAFRQKFPDALPDSLKRIEEVEASLMARRGTTQQRDYEEAQERVEEFLRKNGFVPALSEADKLLEAVKGDLGLHQKAVALRERVVDQVRIFVEDRRRRAQEYRARGDRELAGAIYDEVLKTLGEGRVEAYQGYVELILRERGE